jgi:hypothetical protein
MGRTGADHSHAHHQGAPGALSQLPHQGVAHTIQSVLRSGCARSIDFTDRPTHHIEFAKLRQDTPILDRDQEAAFGPGLSHMTALSVAREQDPWIFMQNLVLVDVAKRPVVVSLGQKALDGAGGIWLVPLTTVDTGMQQAYVEEGRIGLRVGD